MLPLGEGLTTMLSQVWLVVPVDIWRFDLEKRFKVAFLLWNKAIDLEAKISLGLVFKKPSPCRPKTHDQSRREIKPVLSLASYYPWELKRERYKTKDTYDV